MPRTHRHNHPVHTCTIWSQVNQNGNETRCLVACRSFHRKGCACKKTQQDAIQRLKDATCRTPFSALECANRCKNTTVRRRCCQCRFWTHSLSTVECRRRLQEARKRSRRRLQEARKSKSRPKETRKEEKAKEPERRNKATSDLKSLSILASGHHARAADATTTLDSLLCLM